jgi:hypothetical protein
MSSYYHNPIPANAILTNSTFNTRLGDLDRILYGLHNGDIPWTDLGVAPAVPAAGYAHLYFQGSAFSLLFPDGSGQSVPQFAVLQQQEPSGTGGGSTVAVTWNQRTINTEVVNPGFVTLAANAFTLPPGQYLFFINAQAFVLNETQLRLYETNPTPGVTLYGGSFFATDTTIATLWGYINIAATSTYILEHYSTIGTPNNGMGVPAGTGDVEVYMNLEIWKL